MFESSNPVLLKETHRSLSSLQCKDGWNEFGEVTRCERLRDGAGGLEVTFARAENARRTLMPKKFQLGNCLQTRKEISCQRCGLGLKGYKGRYSDRLDSEVGLTAAH